MDRCVRGRAIAGRSKAGEGGGSKEIPDSPPISAHLHHVGTLGPGDSFELEIVTSVAANQSPGKCEYSYVISGDNIASTTTNVVKFYAARPEGESKSA